MFKRKIYKNPEWTDKAAGKIAGAGVRLQEKFAAVMGRMFSKNIRTFFVVFCLSAGGYSIYLIIDVVFSDGVKQPVIQIDQATIPRHIDKTGDELIVTEQYVDDETYRQLQGFKLFMDSLKVGGSKLYDSIVTARPGLMDSTRMLIELYHQQQKR